MSRMMVLPCACLLASVLACDRAAFRRDETPTAATDTATIASVAPGPAAPPAREPRPLPMPPEATRPARAPSAIQRVTGVVQPRIADGELDSLLAVRVLDARGGELPNVPVRWSLVAPGDDATLRVISASTDSAGISAAAFTPGRSADIQEVFAEVAGVGRITFSVTVPAAGARIAPERLALWSGDDTVATATLYDAAGAALGGGQVAWRVRDTAVVSVARLDGVRARVTGSRAGDTELLAYTSDGKVRASARVTVRPVTSVRFVTLDGGAPPAMRVSLRSEGVRAELPAVGATHTARVPMDPDAPAFIHASPVDSAAQVHDVVLRVDDHRALQRLVVALVPKIFTIPRGSHEGQRIAIDAERAMQRMGGGAAFWRLVPLSGTGPRKLLGWHESAYPLRLAFNRAESRESISGDDSTAFWRIAGDMERDLGRDLFVPADMRDTSEHPVVRIEVRPHSAEGHTFVSWDHSGDATDAVLLFARAATLRNRQVVTHELVHVLGFGHASAWPTIASPRDGSESRLTASDVAYMQLAMRLRALQESTGALPGLPVAAPPRRR